MLTGSGPSGLMYILRARALETERGDSPDLSVIYAPGTLVQARRRLLVVWMLSLSWLVGLLDPLLAIVTSVSTFLGAMLALSTQFEAAWIGSPIRRWSMLGIPLAIIGFVVLTLTVG